MRSEQEHFRELPEKDKEITRLIMERDALKAELDLLKMNFQFQLRQTLRGVRVCND